VSSTPSPSEVVSWLTPKSKKLLASQ